MGFLKSRLMDSPAYRRMQFIFKEILLTKIYLSVSIQRVLLVGVLLTTPPREYI